MHAHGTLQLSTQCSLDGLQIGCDPDQGEAAIKDELMKK